MQCLITAIVAVILLVGAASSCPIACGCIDTSYGVDVNCSSRGLDSIPTDLPNNTYVLWLNYNNISVIENNAFNNLPNLQYLFVNNNKITSVKSDTFNNLTNLKELFLNNNNITSIKSDTFNNLTNLDVLFVNNNNITSITSDTFNSFTNLYVLGLQNNDISVIEDKAFNNLGNLRYLFLNNNKITSIKSDTFNNLTNLYTLRMANNPIAFVSEHAFENLPRLTSLNFDMHCGSCDNFPFWRWLKEPQRYPTSITCNDFDGEYLPSVQLNKVTDCSVHGNWGTWTDWNSCSLTCGSGSRSRHQECNNPKPAYGGSDCQGNDTEIELCSIELCPVHGNWGTWKDWNSCSLTCGGGSRSRRQECNNPEPAYGGTDCQGNDTEIELCSIELCPVTSEEDSSSAAIGIGAGIGSTAVVVGLLIVFIYILRRYRLRKADESAIYETAGDTRSSNSDLHIYDGLQPNTESPTHRQNEVNYVNMVI